MDSQCIICIRFSQTKSTREDTPPLLQEEKIISIYILKGENTPASRISSGRSKIGENINNQSAKKGS